MEFNILCSHICKTLTLPTTHSHLQEKSNRLSNFAKRTGLHINQKKTQVMFVNAPTAYPITINGESLECIEDFRYHALTKPEVPSVADSITSGSPSNTASKLRSGFTTLPLRPSFCMTTECWRITKGDTRTVAVFHNSSLRKICNIYWPNKMWSCIRRQIV